MFTHGCSLLPFFHIDARIKKRHDLSISEIEKWGKQEHKESVAKKRALHMNSKQSRRTHLQAIATYQPASKRSHFLPCTPLNFCRSGIRRSRMHIETTCKQNPIKTKQI